MSSPVDVFLALLREKWLPITRRGQYVLSEPSNMIAAHVVTVLEDAGFTITGPTQDGSPYWTDERLAELFEQSRADRHEYAEVIGDEDDDEFAGLTVAKEAGLW